MTREQDAQTIISAIEAVPEALELRARVAAAIRNRGRADPAGVEREALRLCADGAWMILDAHPEIAHLLAPPAAASLAVYLLRGAAAVGIGSAPGSSWVVEMDLRDRSHEN
jgi:hypothetical protein